MTGGIRAKEMGEVQREGEMKREETEEGVNDKWIGENECLGFQPATKLLPESPTGVYVMKAIVCVCVCYRVYR